MSLGTQIIASFILGLVVSFLNYWVADDVLRQWIEAGSQESTEKERKGFPTQAAVRYLVRYGTNFLAIYVVYALGGEPAALLATGLGLLIARNVFLIRYLLKGKEG